ncbi:MAG: isochorismatase family protein [Bacteroides sp.]|nr:isochorismatase family protein [Bacteroides sp.]
MKNKMLLIVDPQIDFITGSLPVPGAEEAMNSLAEFIKTRQGEYSAIVLTADRHPMNHTSFKKEGGEWPVHCVADSVGAAIWPAILDELLDFPGKVAVVHKGENPDVEEYSIFRNSAATKIILEIVNNEKIDQIDICGLAGDVCVSETIRDAVALGTEAKINVLLAYSPSLDGGKTLGMIISDYGLACG